MSDAPDLSAFWLYPDWDGPLKEPFWMRPLKLPPEVNFSGTPYVPVPFLPNDGYADLGASYDREGRKPMVRVVGNPSIGQYVFKPRKGMHLSGDRRGRYFGKRALRFTSGQLGEIETVSYNWVAEPLEKTAIDIRVPGKS